MPEKSTFSRLRQKAQVSIEEVSSQLGYSQSTIYRWERGEIEPKAAVFRALAN